MEKRQPTLADLLLARKPHQIEHVYEHAKMVPALQARVRIAEKFVFDETASRRVGEIIRDIPELIVEQIQFARAPFEVTWLEYQSHIIWQTLTPGGTPEIDGDKKVGLLIDHNRVNIFSYAPGVTDGEPLGLMPFAYHLNTEWPLDEQLKLADLLQTSRMGIDFWLWGSVADKFMRSGKADYLRILRDTNMIVPLLPHNFPDHSETQKQAAQRILNGCSGDFRNVVALLLLLNQPSMTQYRTTLPHTRRFIGNKLSVLMKHRTITVSLDAKPRVIELSQGLGDGETRARHKVRGHYCQDKMARDYERIAGCIHDWRECYDDWTPMTDASNMEVNHWFCGICEGKRWFRKEHERGDINKGYITHDYKVTD